MAPISTTGARIARLDNGPLARQRSPNAAANTEKLSRSLSWVACITSINKPHDILRADKLADCKEGSSEEQELEAIVNAIEAYEANRRPGGKIPGGKG
jgi:hypothetical protein